MKQKNPLYYVIPVAIILIVVAFYGGMQYGQAASQQQRQQRLAQFGGNGFGGAGGNAAFGGMGRQGRGNAVAGEIVSKDATSVTVKLPTGGSKIIFYSASTQMTKPTPATADDLKTGATIIVNGTPNSDGSVTAQMIQFRPALPAQGANGATGTNGMPTANSGASGQAHQ